MPNLVLGVVEVPYDNGTLKKARKAPKKPKKGKAGVAAKAEKPRAPSKDKVPTTTVQVAQALEDKYGVMAVFYDHFQNEVIGAVVHSMEGALESLYMGGPLGDPYAEAGQEIAAGFRQFLLQGEIEDYGIEGVPTQAALDRKSLRFKSKVGPTERPSFIDTGHYELAFRAWVE